MMDAGKPKLVTRLEPRRVELARSTYQSSKAELEGPITLPQLSLEEAARRLMEPVEIHPIDQAPARGRPATIHTNLSQMTAEERRMFTMLGHWGYTS